MTRREPFVGEDEVLVHIGLPKTGTTALQSCAAAAREELLRHGVLYPGTARAHVLASFAPLEWFETPEIEERARRQWAAITSKIARHDGRAFVSAENLCVGDDAAVRRVVADLGADRVRVVLTLRALHHVLPSFWQHEVRAGVPTPFDEWASNVAKGNHSVGGIENFWSIFEVGRVLERWADVLGPDRVAVVVVDPKRPDGILTDTAALLGLPDGVLDPAIIGQSNRSLTAAESEIIRRVNVRMAGSPPVDEDVLNGRYVRSSALRHLIEWRQPDPTEQRLTLSDETRERLRPFAEAAVADIERVAPRIVGDLRQLVPPPTGDASGSTGAAPVESVPIDAALLLLEEVLKPPERTPARPPAQAPAPERAPAPAPEPAPSASGPTTSGARRLARKLIPHSVRRAIVSRVR